MFPPSTDDPSRKILHVDGDGFFAACEVAKNPSLRGLPVIVGKERGIALALTYEAKALGVRRGMLLGEIRSLCPNAIFLPSDFATYVLFSERMQRIVSRYSNTVEHYSIDECFADLTEIHLPKKHTHKDVARKIKQSLQDELGITFSVGLAPTKVLAKVASRMYKPNGFSVIEKRDIPDILSKIPIETVWGIGRQTSTLLKNQGITYALTFANTDYSWVYRHLAKPYREIWHELQGESVFFVKERTTLQQSLMRTRTFSPSSNNKDVVFAQLVKNIEIACMKIRQQHIAATHAMFFLKTQKFRYRKTEIRLPHPTNTPEELLLYILPHAESLWSHEYYRATGIVLSGFCDPRIEQLDLFGNVLRESRWKKIYETVDAVNRKYDTSMIHLAKSMSAQNERRSKKTFAKTLRLPHAGEIA